MIIEENVKGGKIFQENFILYDSDQNNKILTLLQLTKNFSKGNYYILK